MIETELLSPAGNWDCARAAVANGADAIYFGLPQFNARMRADNFTEEDLPELMRFLHRHGVKGFVAMNTLIFQKELGAATKQIERMGLAGVDAVIVQDLGLASLMKKIAPQMEVHASTQMTITSPEGLAFVDGILNLERAVLSRELSVEEIGRVGRKSEVPLEVFVHGALCVAYSGQCLTSESLGQRSANRGECAQACRMPYELVVDGKTVPLGELGEVRYLLSPQDLAAVEVIPDLVRAGVRSYKIEGRLKSPEYVAAVTSVYRKALDNSLTANEESNEESNVSDHDKYMLEMTFSRGLTSGWLEGTNHPYLTHGKWGKKRGVYVGEVAACGEGWIEVEDAEVSLAAGEGFVFDAGEDRNKEQGGIIYQAQEGAEGLWRLVFDKRANIDWQRVKVGMGLYKTSDPKLESSVRKMWKGVRLEEKGRVLDVAVSGAVGEKLVVTCQGKRVESEVVLEAAENRPLSEEAFAAQFAKLGGTDFQLGEVAFQVEGGVIVRMSELNRMRRALVDALGQEVFTANDSAEVLRNSEALIVKNAGAEVVPQLRVLCRSLAQVRGALRADCLFIYADFEDLREYAEAVALVREHGEAEIYLATPRIQKPSDTGFFKLIQRAEPDGVLVRNLGAVEYFKQAGVRRVGDFSLNVSNAVTAQVLMESGGFENLTVSYDLNSGQVVDLLEGANPEWFELTLHQHMPMFHMEHCVFCTFLSEGTSIKDCGKPCDKHEVKLRDRVGQLHVLKADVGCRNTLFNGRAQTGAGSWKEFAKAGLSQFRLELLDESEEEAVRVVSLYQRMFQGEVSSAGVTAELGLISRLGVTEGTMTARREEVH